MAQMTSTRHISKNGVHTARGTNVHTAHGTNGVHTVRGKYNFHTAHGTNGVHRARGADNVHTAHGTNVVHTTQRHKVSTQHSGTDFVINLTYFIQ